MKLRNRIVRRTGWTFAEVADLTFVEFFDVLRPDDEPDHPVYEFARMAAPNLAGRALERELA